MSAAKCAICNKTAYPLESLTALDQQYHKACFKCATCKQSLNLKNFKGYQGKIYCAVHTPKPQATTVTDSVAIKNALNAPKKTSEGLGTVKKGSGGKPQIAVFGGGEGGAAGTEVEVSGTTYEEGGGEATYEEATEETTYGGEEQQQEEEVYDE